MFPTPGGHESQIMHEWVGLAMGDSVLFDTAILLQACRSILRSRPHDKGLRDTALQYRAHGLKALSKTVGASALPVSANTVARALALAIDEVRIPISCQGA